MDPSRKPRLSEGRLPCERFSSALAIPARVLRLTLPWAPAKGTSKVHASGCGLLAHDAVALPTVAPTGERGMRNSTDKDLWNFPHIRTQEGPVHGEGTASGSTWGSARPEATDALTSGRVTTPRQQGQKIATKCKVSRCRE